MKVKTGSTLAQVALLALALGCVRQPLRGQPVHGVDRKLSTFAYIEEGDLVTFIVNTKAARDRDGAAYVPCEIAVANRGLKKLALTRESFTLIDAGGRRYPMASPRELLERYDFLEIDQQLAELEGIVFNKFGALTRYPSRFSPSRSADTSRTSVVQDLVVLPRFGYILDFIYFPLPEGGVRGQTFELFLESPDLEEPAFVKFQVL